MRTKTRTRVSHMFHKEWRRKKRTVSEQHAPSIIGDKKAFVLTLYPRSRTEIRTGQSTVQIALGRFLHLHLRDLLIHRPLLASVQMRSLTKNILRISNLYPPRSSVQVGRCHYHSGLNKVPIVKTIDDEILVKVNLGISRQIELR